VLTGTFIITPYALTYDMGLFAAAVGLMATRDKSTWPEQKERILILTLAMLLPILMIPVGTIGGPLAPIIVLTVFFIALRDAGFTFAVPLWRGGSGKLATATSPAVASD